MLSGGVCPLDLWSGAFLLPLSTAARELLLETAGVAQYSPECTPTRGFTPLHLSYLPL